MYEPKYLQLFPEWIELCSDISDEHMGQIFKGILHYVAGEEYDTDSKDLIVSVMMPGMEFNVRTRDQVIYSPEEQAADEMAAWEDD